MNRILLICVLFLVPRVIVGQGAPGSPVSAMQLGDSASIAQFVDGFRKTFAPDAPSLKLAFAQMHDGSTDFFAVLTKGIPASAVDSLQRGLFALLAKPNPDFARRAITLEVSRGDAPALRAWESKRTPPEFRNHDRLLKELSRAARKAGTHGRIQLWILVDESGNVAQTRIDQSSGNSDFDKAIEAAVRDARFFPAQLEGIAASTWIRVPFVVQAQ